jgi:hypothetical protein
VSVRNTVAKKLELVALTRLVDVANKLFTFAISAERFVVEAFCITELVVVELVKILLLAFRVSVLVVLANKLLVYTLVKIEVIALNIFEKKLEDVALTKLDDVAKSELVVAF